MMHSRFMTQTVNMGVAIDKEIGIYKKSTFLQLAIFIFGYNFPREPIRLDIWPTYNNQLGRKGDSESGEL